MWYDKLSYKLSSSFYYQQYNDLSSNWNFRENNFIENNMRSALKMAAFGIPKVTTKAQN